MPNALLITEVEFAQVKSFVVKRSLDVSPPLLDSDGTVVDADARNPINEISLKGEGDIDGALITGAEMETSLELSGYTLIHGVEVGQKNKGGYDTFSVEATNAPGASAPV